MISMKINNKKMQEYYKNYFPCHCGDCSHFIKHIETEQPEICNYLKSLCIDPLKPYELMSVYHKKIRQLNI